MADGADEFDVDPEIALRDSPELGGGDDTAMIGVEVRNTHVSVVLNEALEQVKDHPYKPGKLLHERIRYELNCEGYDIERYHQLEITFPVSDELELGEVTFIVEVCGVGVLPEGL